jgi:hypothetical protein
MYEDWFDDHRRREVKSKECEKEPPKSRGRVPKHCLQVDIRSSEIKHDVCSRPADDIDSNKLHTYPTAKYRPEPVMFGELGSDGIIIIIEISFEAPRSESTSAAASPI